MRKMIAMASRATMKLALTAAPAVADTNQEGLIKVGNVAVGANVCDVKNVIVENDAAAQGQSTNEQNN